VQALKADEDLLQQEVADAELERLLRTLRQSD